MSVLHSSFPYSPAFFVAHRFFFFLLEDHGHPPPPSKGSLSHLFRFSLCSSLFLFAFRDFSKTQPRAFSGYAFCFFYLAIPRFSYALSFSQSLTRKVLVKGKDTVRLFQIPLVQWRLVRTQMRGPTPRPMLPEHLLLK